METWVILLGVHTGRIIAVIIIIIIIIIIMESTNTN